MNISVKKITHFGMIYNEVLLTRKTPSGNANRRIFCAAGNNERVSKRRNRATSGEQRFRQVALQVFGMFPAWGAKCGSGGGSGEGVLGNTGVLLLLFRPSDKGHCLYKKRSFLLLRNSGCQITGKYQTATPCRPHYLRRAVKNILRPALPP